MTGSIAAMIKMMGLTEDEYYSLLHMTGGDRPDQKPGWRNRAILSPDDKTMAGLIEKKLVKDNGVYSGNEMSKTHFFYATPKGLLIAKSLYWAAFGEQNYKSKKHDLNKANGRLYDNGLEPVVHY